MTLNWLVYSSRSFNRKTLVIRKVPNRFKDQRSIPGQCRGSQSLKRVQIWISEVWFYTFPSATKSFASLKDRVKIPTGWAWQHRHLATLLSWINHRGVIWNSDFEFARSLKKEKERQDSRNWWWLYTVDEIKNVGRHTSQIKRNSPSENKIQFKQWRLPVH